MKTRIGLVALLTIVGLVTIPVAAQDLYMKDTTVPGDTGVEPNPDTGPMWISDDVWVRITPDPGYQPYPFNAGAPPWTPLPHENPEYRDPKFSVPNYVYVRVRNRGSAASSGTERLRVYFAKASTGLSWPTQWVDYVASTCGPAKLFGAEITKPRKNAATATAAERDAYRNAVLAIGTTAGLVFPDSVDYWHKQNVVHAQGPTNRHTTAAFLPWHREFVNRYEVLLQEFDPTVKLLYWDWTTNPETGPFNLDTATFMGASGSGSGGANAGTPFNPTSGPTLAPPTIVRDLGGGLVTAPTSVTDATLTGLPTYPSSSIEGPPHNNSHTYIGGAVGQMRAISTAAQDPFFFLLHGNVDRLWAQWQRGATARLDPAAVYGAFSGDSNITTNMGPWDGVHFQTGPIDPWSTSGTGGYIVTKLPSDPSVVSPPIYDTAPLTIPVLQPGEAVVMQIPWYPPNPADFSCFGGDQGHFCLLARIETALTAPFGMTTPETTNVYDNTRNNNNIAWKNVTVVDNFPGALRLTSILLRNPFKDAVKATLRFANTRTGPPVFGTARVFVDLKPELFRRWREGGGAGRGIKPVEGAQQGRIEIANADAILQGIELRPDETFSVDVSFVLPKDYKPRNDAPQLDMIQLGTPEKETAIVGGQRFTLDLGKIVVAKRRDVWRYWDGGAISGTAWTSLDFDDAKWKRGKADLGFGLAPATTIQRQQTAYFRRTFDVDDPEFDRTVSLRLKRDDGAVVYLNGKEIHRVHLPDGAIAPDTPATQEVGGAEAETYFAVNVDRGLLQRGRNVLAAEVHLRSPRSRDLTFDAALEANPAAGQAPYVVVGSPRNGALFQPKEIVPVRVDAVDGDGKIRSVSLFVDGKLLGTATEAPFAFKWTAAGNGMHRIKAVAVGSGGLRSEAFVSVGVVPNRPPDVALAQPREGATFRAGEDIAAAATASDRGGSVARVEFWAKEADLFSSEPVLMATAREAPFKAVLRGLKPGHYMVWAVAIDNGGASTQSIPVHVMVE